MAKTTFNLGLLDQKTTREAYSFVDSRPVGKWKRGGYGRVTTVPLAAFDLRRYTWNVGTSEALRRAWSAFFQAVGWERTSFFLQDPRDPVRSALSPTAGTGALTTFPLPTSIADADYPFFPANDGSAYAVVGGVIFNAASVDQDARTITLAAAPGVAAVTLVYQPLRLVILEAPAEVQSIARVLVAAAFELQQLSRD